jgi:LPXTG-motif cell wall-anchored protein
MGIVNKRNAVLGWLTWTVGKRVAKRKAKSAVPAVEGGKPNKPAIAAGIAALAGTLLFWRKARKRGDSAESESESESE